MSDVSPGAGAEDGERIDFAVELISRICAVVGLGAFALVALRNAQRHHDAVAWLQLVDQSLNVLFILIARWPKAVDRRPLVVILAVSTTFSTLVIDHNFVHALVPRAATYSLQIGGILFQVFAKLSLGRSLGIVPANRGVRTGGAYRIVRHPMYLGYAIAQLGVLLGLASWRNLIAIACVYALLAVRVFLEEKILARDESYRAYQARVPWRIAPFVY